MSEPIRYLWVFVGDEERGQGILAERMGLGWTPFVTGSERTADLLRERALRLGWAAGGKIVEKRFKLESEEVLLYPTGQDPTMPPD